MQMYSLMVLEVRNQNSFSLGYSQAVGRSVLPGLFEGKDCFLAFSGSSGHLYSLACISSSIFKVRYFSLCFCHHINFCSDPELLCISVIRTFVTIKLVVHYLDHPDNGE